jgi:predicted nucleic acid-binding protein
LLLYFADHPRAKSLITEVNKTQRIGYVPSLVWIEFYYKTVREFGKKIAQIKITALRKSSLEEFQLNNDHYIQVGNIKVAYPNLSFVDAVVVSTAKLIHGKIITTEVPMTKIPHLKAEKLKF